MKKTNWLIIAGVILITVLGYVFISTNYHSKDKKLSNPTTRTAKIVITPGGFKPAIIYVKKGTKVVWTNTDTAIHQIYANPHPTGTSLPGLKSPVLNNQQTYYYIADKVGTYGYHDQLNPTINGTIDVKD